MTGVQTCALPIYSFATAIGLLRVSLDTLISIPVLLAKEADAAVECAFGLPKLARGAMPGILPGALSEI